MNPEATTFFEWAFLAGAVGAVIALAFAFVKARGLLAHSEGTAKMKKLASAIRAGADAYLKRQFRVIAIFFVVFAIVLGILAIVGWVTPFIPFAFLTGGLFSQLAAFIGMKVATRANARTAAASEESLNRGLKVAFASGSVMSFTVVGLAMFDVAVWFVVLRFVFNQEASAIAENMVMFGVGAAMFALFARVGGGIFTKAADVGADLVGKVEAGIPEDDPRNPATIADNVGDNVGDVAGMGADLFESFIKAIHAGIALGFAAFVGSDLMWNAMFLPLAIMIIGTLTSLVGTFLVRTKEGATQADLLGTLRKGTYASAASAIVLAFPLVWWIMGLENWMLWLSVVTGAIAGVLIGYFTEYFTSDHYKPTKKLAAAAETGSATTIIGGISLGMRSTVPAVLIVAGAIVASFLFAGGQFTVDYTGVLAGHYGTYEYAIALFELNFAHGLYGIGLAAVGMLCTLAITLATDAYGPVADNAGGIAEMAGMDPKVRQRTDALDSLGNTTAATGKGFAIGSAALTSLALLASYIQIATGHHEAAGRTTLDLSVNNPSVLIGLFIGAMTVFIFSAMTMTAVQNAAQSIVVEVRRQFREIKGIMDGSADPDYANCVDLCTRGALRSMVAPTVVAVVVPVVTGLIFGVEGVVGVIGGATVTGFVVAVFMANAGGAWDNAKKYIESGAHGGKGSEAHKAAVIGDTVGDPFKDTTGPSINTLFKMISTVSITVVYIVATYSLL
ncbi:MAG: sodium-translocating pyrophosphatase [Promicromonosporaceae bacterium]|nr:sodium-translocating pyrophosphatase [Promicromonosporaceae bacterium]